MRAKSLGDWILQGENLGVKVLLSALVTFTYSWGEVWPHEITFLYLRLFKACISVNKWAFPVVTLSIKRQKPRSHKNSSATLDPRGLHFTSCLGIRRSSSCVTGLIHLACCPPGSSYIVWQGHLPILGQIGPHCTMSPIGLLQSPESRRTLAAPIAQLSCVMLVPTQTYKQPSATLLPGTHSQVKLI